MPYWVPICKLRSLYHRRVGLLVYKKYWGEGGNHIAFHAYIWTFTSSFVSIWLILFQQSLVQPCICSWLLGVIQDYTAMIRISSFRLPFFRLIVLLSLVVHVITIDPGQLGLKIDVDFARNGKYFYSAVAKFQDDVLATWQVIWEPLQRVTHWQWQNIGRTNRSSASLSKRW